MLCLYNKQRYPGIRKHNANLEPKRYGLAETRISLQGPALFRIQPSQLSKTGPRDQTGLAGGGSRTAAGHHHVDPRLLRK